MKKQLLFSVTKKDFDITFFSGTGAGGQHRNKHMNSVRISHAPSNAKATAQDSRSKDINLKAAFNRIVKTVEFKNWHRIEIARRAMTNDDKRLAKKEMSSVNLRVEVKKDGKWVEENKS